jgi:hypothetical protein
MFVKPLVQDLVTVKEILRIFSNSSGLTVNYNKSSTVVIQGEVEDGMVVKHVLYCELGEFPCRYLGLQLSTIQLNKVHWQPVLDHVVASLPAWQRGLLQRSGCLILIKSVIMARTVHQLLIADGPVWLLEEINRWARGSFWAGKDRVNGGQCLVSRQQVCKPICYGGLGVKILRLQGIALRVRWEWLRRTDPNRPWQGLPSMQDEMATTVFDSLVRITVGDESKTLFWRDRWIRGATAGDIAPLVYDAVRVQCRNRRTVSEAMRNHRWVGDIRGNLTELGVRQCLFLLASICTMNRDIDSPDQFSWPWSSTGMYTASSTYRMLCHGSERWACAKWVWASWAPLKCKIFAWLALQFRLWTSERRKQHHLEEEVAACYTCLQEEDTTTHIFTECVYTRQVWLGCFSAMGIGVATPSTDDSL